MEKSDDRNSLTSIETSWWNDTNYNMDNGEIHSCNFDSLETLQSAWRKIIDQILR